MAGISTEKVQNKDYNGRAVVRTLIRTLISLHKGSLEITQTVPVNSVNCDVMFQELQSIDVLHKFNWIR